MAKGLGLACFLLAASLAGPVLAAPAKPMPAKPAPAKPGEPAEPAWVLEKGRAGLVLAYGTPEAPAIYFTCAPHSGDVNIRVPEASGKAKLDQTQSVSLTIGGVRSSFAGRVVEDERAGGLSLDVVATVRNPMFIALAGPGGMRIEGKGFTRIVPLRGIEPKLGQFLATCRK